MANGGGGDNDFTVGRRAADTAKEEREEKGQAEVESGLHLSNRAACLNDRRTNERTNERRMDLWSCHEN